jgi:membrane protease YdiL (CAAX protease family)
MILYLVLFFPAINFSPANPEYITFSINRELNRLFIYNIPSLALVWYLLWRGKNKKPLRIRPGPEDLQSALLALPGLLGIGFLVSLTAALFPALPAPPKMDAPRGFLPWLALAAASLGAGYLEESYFRAYLHTLFAEAGLGPRKGIAVSAALFALCHLYEGPWGALNALLAGIFLSLVFIRKKSLHGLAWAHGGYNVLVYLFSAAGG